MGLPSVEMYETNPTSKSCGTATHVLPGVINNEQIISVAVN